MYEPGIVHPQKSKSVAPSGGFQNLKRPQFPPAYADGKETAAPFGAENQAAGRRSKKRQSFCAAVAWQAPSDQTTMFSMAGELITETFGYDGGRQVAVYLPAGRPEAVVFASDGQLISQWGGDLEAADVPPTMVVGVHPSADEWLRLHEYSPGFDQDRFAAHEKFFVDDVRRWVGSRFGVAPPANTRPCSASRPVANSRWRSGWDTRTSTVRSSARHPAAVTDHLPCCRARFRASTSSPAHWSRFSSRTPTLWADALRAAGADVVLTERVGGHGDAFWREEFPLMVAWAFQSACKMDPGGVTEGSRG